MSSVSPARNSEAFSDLCVCLFTHLTPYCGRILKLLHLILTFIAVGQMLTASLLLSQGCGLSCSLQSLSDPQFWSSFLPVFTSYLLMPPLAIGVVHTGSWPHSTYWEPIHCQGIPSGLRAHFLMESTAHLVGSVSRIAALRVLSATVLASPHSPVMQHRTQYFGWGEKEVGFFGSSLRSLLTHTDFPLWEKSWAKNISWHWALPPWGRSDVCKVRLFLSPSTMHPSSLFCPSGVLGPLCWKPELPERLSYPWVYCLKMVFSRGSWTAVKWD